MATLAAGSSSGIAVGQPVRAPDGLVGRVIETGRWASRVLLVTDGASNVPVRLVRDGTPAIAAGRGDGTIELRTLEVGQNPFRAGDILVTSGTGGIFPPNIPVAVVVRPEGDTAIARALADPARADFALVLRPYQPAATAPLDQAAPPSAGPPVGGPTPAATPNPGRQNDPRYQPALQSPPPQGAGR
jgi:rod shape-determining protein MreC